MKNVAHKNTWNSGVTQVYVDTPPIPLIKMKHGDKSDNDFVKLKLRRDTTSENLDLYAFNMALFDNEKMEEFLFFVHNFNMTLAESGKLATDEKVHYFCIIVCGEPLHQVDSFLMT